MTQTTTSVHIDDVLDTFRGDVRARMRALLDNLGNGLADRGAALREAFVEVVPLVRAADNVSEQLARRPALTRRLVHNASAVTQELAWRQRALRQLVADGTTNVATLQDGAADLDATLRELPPALTAARTSLEAVESVLGDVNSAVGSLRPVARDLPAALRDLRTLSAVATPALRSLDTPVRQLVPFARALSPLAARLGTAVTRLRPQAGAVDHTTFGLSKCMRAIQGFFHWDGSLSKFGDARGIVARGNLTMGASSGGLNSSPFESKVTECAPGAPAPGRPIEPSDLR